MTSTQESETQQAEANILWLAELECAAKNGYEAGQRHDVACVCQGTGAQYPQLREKCNWHWNYYLGRFSDRNDCNKCQGKNWLPVSREKAGTELRKLESFISLVLLHWPPDPSEPKRYRGMYWGREEQYWDFADDPNNATIAALTKMEEANA